MTSAGDPSSDRPAAADAAGSIPAEPAPAVPGEIVPTAELDDPRRLAAMFAGFDRLRRVLGRHTTLGTADLRLLWLFTDGEPRTLRQIAEQLGLEQSTVNRQTNHAIKAGLLVRTRDGDVGPYRFTSSPLGQREFEANLNATLDTYRAALDGLGPKRQQFLDLMTEFLDAYDRAITDR